MGSFEGEPVLLYQYDLSNGLARQWGQMLTGRHVEGIWHTSLVLFGMEVFYGQGISIVQPPGTTHHGTPMKTIDVGITHLDRETFLEYIQGMRDVYSAEKYHLLDFNCNSFTNDVLGFLNGNQIPEEIRNLPRDILSTPFGQQMRPMIDQMFRGRETPSAQNAIDTLLPPLTAQAASRTAAQDDVSRSSLTSNLSICTSAASLSTTLSTYPAVVVMYTSRTCPPCVAIRPFFEELARKNVKVGFVLLEMDMPGAGDLAGDVKATPTFRFFLKGQKTGEDVKGADKKELETRVGMLVLECWPPHPHSTLLLPSLVKLTHSLSPVTYTSQPHFVALREKLSTFLASSIDEDSRRVLTIDFINALSSNPPSPTESVASASSWSKASSKAIEVLPPKEWFPILDLWRVALTSSIAATVYLPAFEELLSTLLPRLADLDGEEAGKATSLTSIRLVSNVLPFGSLETDVRLEQTTRLIVRSLLDADKSVRSAGAGLAWSVVARKWEKAEGGGAAVDERKEEWEVEMAAAVTEALQREEESGEVVHRLAATLALVFFKSRNHEAIRDLLGALDAEQVLKSKEKLIAKEDGKALLRDIIKLL